MAKNYLRESRLSHKQAKKTLTSAIILSEFYCFARVSLLLASFFIGWLVLSKLPFAAEWNLPATVFGTFATLMNFDLPLMHIVVQWLGVLAFVGVVLAVIFNIFSAQVTILKAFRDVDRRLFGDRYVQAYQNSVKNLCHYVSRYRNLLKFFEEELKLTKGWHKKIHKKNSWHNIFAAQEYNGKIVEKELKSSKRSLKKVERAIKKEEKKLRNSSKKDVKSAKKRWKKYWKAQKKEAVANAKNNIGTRRGNLKLLKAKKKTLRKQFNEESVNRLNTHIDENDDTAYRNEIEAKLSALKTKRMTLKERVGRLRSIVVYIEKCVVSDLGLRSRKTACGIALNNAWVLKQIKKYEKRFKKEAKNCKKSLSREQRNKILYRRCRNVRELLFPEKEKMRPNYTFQWIIDAFDFLRGFKKNIREVLLGDVDYSYYREEWMDKLGVNRDDQGSVALYNNTSEGIINTILQSEGFESDPNSYEVNGYDEGIRKAGVDFTQWKRCSKKDSIFLYERPICSKYTYNKGFCINIRNLVYCTFVAFFVVVIACIFKSELPVKDYFKALYLLFIPIGVGTIFHFVLGCWAGGIVKIRADEDIGEWYDITLADRLERNVGELLPLRNGELRRGSIVRNTRKNRAFILHRQPREHSVTLYFFRNFCQFIAMAGLMILEILFINAIGEKMGKAMETVGGLSQILAWVMIGVWVLSLLFFKIISRYVFSMNEYNVDCMEDDVRSKARKRYKLPVFLLAILGIVLIVALILLNMMQISYIALAGVFVFLAFIAWLADCVIHHKDVDADDYGFFMESDNEEERDPTDSY